MTPKLSEVARHLVVPEGIVSSTFPAAYHQLKPAGIALDRWQIGLGMAALGCDATGQYASTVGGVVISIPRQVGKTFTIGSLIVGLCLAFPRLRVVWTSHHARTTTNTFRSMQAIARKPAIFARLAPNGIRQANGEQEIAFANGSIVMYGAREQGFGRGMDAVDLVVFDEAQILTLKALEDMVPAANQARHPHGALVMMMGTPPRPTDPGEAFRAKREAAISGRERAGMYVELSADPDASPDDPAQWARANPSYPQRTPHAAMLRMRSNIPGDAAWRREALGIWDETDSVPRLISADEWAAIRTTTPPPDGLRALGVAYSLDGQRVALAGAVRHDNGIHLELIAAQAAPIDHEALADWIELRWRTMAQVSITGKAGAPVLAQALRDRRVPARVAKVASGEEYYSANAMLAAAILEGSITVPAAPADDPLELAIANCDRKARGASGAWAWVGSTPDADPTPLEALGLALHGARTTTRHPGRSQEVL